MKNYLDQTERQRLLEQHKRERDKRICDRIKAVLLYDQGWSLQRIAEALFISHEAVRQHLLDYEANRKLSPENGGSVSKLNKACRQMLINHLKGTIYTSAKEIVALVLEAFDIKYTVSGMTQWLKNNGFSYKKPTLVPGKADPEAQQQWIKYYFWLTENLSDNEVICFMDGVHPTHNTKPSYGWIETGVNRAILSNTGRQRINLSGAIDIESKKVVCLEDETLNADSTIRFLKTLELSYPQTEKIYLFCDNARYYRNNKVKEFLETSKIDMQFLPPYSPNLNPSERLWKLMNEQIINNKYYEKFSDFKNRVLGFLNELSNPLNSYLDILKGRIGDNFRPVQSHQFVNSST